MPFYEYACTSCGAASEFLQKISDPPETECPSCHAQALVKQVSAAGFRLKGGGWYETDFKAGGKRNVAGEAAATDAGSGTATDSGSGGDKSHGCAAGACGCAPKAAEKPVTSSATDTAGTATA